jgi:hypothetical protein
MTELFKGLKLDSWYMAVTYLGGVALLLSFFFEVKGISNNYLQILTGGIFLFGLGEWKNHKNESYIKPSNAYTGPAAYISYTVRRPDAFGLMLNLMGLIMITYGIYLLVSRQ